jgi:hypothetical protein
MYRQDYKNFACQYLMQPELAIERRVIFGQQLLDSQICSSYQLPMPHMCSVFINCDLAGVGSSAEHAEDSCAQVYLRDLTNGRISLIDGFCEPFMDSSSLAYALTELIKNYNPKMIRVEGSMGSALIRGELLAVAAKWGLKNVAERLDFPKPENKANAKKVRIFALAGSFQHDRVRIYENYRDLAILRKQLSKFTSTSRVRGKDDCADALAAGVQWLESLPLEPITIDMTKPLPPPPFDEIPTPGPRDSAPRRGSGTDANERSAAAYMSEMLNPYGKGKL